MKWLSPLILVVLCGWVGASESPKLPKAAFNMLPLAPKEMPKYVSPLHPVLFESAGTNWRMVSPPPPAVERRQKSISCIGGA